MLSRVVLSLALAYLASAANCNMKWPNGTDTKMTWWSCGGDMSFTSVTPQDKQGNYEYPIKLTEPLIIMTDANNPKNTYSSPTLKQDINVFLWNQRDDCLWSKLPTYGLLTNLDACTNGVSCPIRPGQQKIGFELDFSDTPQIIALLTDDAPYEMQYILHDTKLGMAMCLTFQARAYTHVH